MNITIVAIGKTRTEHFEDAISEYQKRLGRWTSVAWRVLPVSDLSRESQQLLKAIDSAGSQAATILLDERGLELSTPEFAKLLDDHQNKATKEILFIIGGAHGVSSEVRQRATHVWSLSQLVFPHEMIRLLLIEQLYRAYDLNNGGKYHHV